MTYPDQQQQDQGQQPPGQQPQGRQKTRRGWVPVEITHAHGTTKGISTPGFRSPDGRTTYTTQQYYEAFPDERPKAPEKVPAAERMTPVKYADALSKFDASLAAIPFMGGKLTDPTSGARIAAARETFIHELTARGYDPNQAVKNANLRIKWRFDPANPVNKMQVPPPAQATMYGMPAAQPAKPGAAAAPNPNDPLGILSTP